MSEKVSGEVSHQGITGTQPTLKVAKSTLSGRMEQRRSQFDPNVLEPRYVRLSAWL